MSTKSRFGGYDKAVAMRLLSTPHGMSYTKIVIIVDEFVDPFDLKQVMWALTTRVRPDKDVFKISWEIYLCDTCKFSWRSTEGINITDPDQYDKRFKLNPAELDAFDQIPPIPKLLKK
ncbi:3-polyprenyl-4-hydroxybenzoate decarboxylase [Pectinatus haikarae]|uniref:3-polyprenyl-4-hydroxybenzoate decarboxylase n=1 Tax=Pectinatus haikarae TaxID=349096 RepID=A0ABT9Y8Y5_9FIRM|nr:3-polyprenyl-4-hydroxybenzoate decarboxylase [Pectinatus haikarae]